MQDFRYFQWTELTVNTLQDRYNYTIDLRENQFIVIFQEIVKIGLSWYLIMQIKFAFENRVY